MRKKESQQLENDKPKQEPQSATTENGKPYETRNTSHYPRRNNACPSIQDPQSLTIENNAHPNEVPEKTQRQTPDPQTQQHITGLDKRKRQSQVRGTAEQ